MPDLKDLKNQIRADSGAAASTPRDCDSDQTEIFHDLRSEADLDDPGRFVGEKSAVQSVPVLEHSFLSSLVARNEVAELQRQDFSITAATSSNEAAMGLQGAPDSGIGSTAALVTMNSTPAVALHP